MGLKPGELFNADLFLQAESVEHARKVYGLIDLLGDLGGVTEVLAIGFGFLLLPLAEHLFVLDATKHLFMVKTKDD